MERDGQLELYDRLAARLRDAHRTVRALQVPEDVRQALTRKLLIITAAAKQDLPGAARRLDRLMEDVDAGWPARDRPGERRDATS
ncbi:hypothetical protein [Streptomyces hainanensis]|uniref:Uncharacterized protein n=1 Tax=Streptomyces hainanensis TaxID=402648 RepID=A0A4R4TVW8_9ACTN|nr:hypothetical protein [Streptomyces hainanensis]TDC79762.1 hypothetical protein E1283_01935 [Streptomyces hainanensis]